MIDMELYQEIIDKHLLTAVNRESLFNTMKEFDESDASIHHVHKANNETIIFYNRLNLMVYQAIVINRCVTKSYFDLRDWTYTPLTNNIISNYETSKSSLAYVAHVKIQYPTKNVLFSEVAKVFGAGSNEAIYVSTIPYRLPPLTGFLEVNGLNVYFMGLVLNNQLVACINTERMEFYYALCTEIPIDETKAKFRFDRLSRDAFHSMIKAIQ